MRQYTIFFFLILLITLYVGCGEDDESPVNGNGGILTERVLPLEVGKTWCATVYYNYGDELPDTMIDMLTVDSIMVINNENWYVVTFILDGSPMYSALMRNREDGLWFWPSTPDNISGDPYLWILFPAEVHDLYTKYGSPEAEVVVVSVDSNITVPYGNFDCYCYKSVSFNGDIISYRFYHPDIGLVKIHTFKTFVEPPMNTIWKLDSLITDQ